MPKDQAKTRAEMLEAIRERSDEEETLGSDKADRKSITRMCFSADFHIHRISSEPKGKREKRAEGRRGDRKEEKKVERIVREVRRGGRGLN